MIAGAGALVVVGLILVICGLVWASVNYLLWIGIAVTVVGVVLLIVNRTAITRRR